MRRLSVVAAAILLSAGLYAQYKDKPPQQQPQPAFPPLISTKPAAANPAPQQPSDGARRIARADATKLVKEGKAVFVDVRSLADYDQEHIKGAISMPLGEITKRVAELPKNKLWITYCA